MQVNAVSSHMNFGSNKLQRKENNNYPVRITRPQQEDSFTPSAPRHIPRKYIAQTAGLMAALGTMFAMPGCQKYEVNAIAKNETTVHIPGSVIQRDTIYLPGRDTTIYLPGDTIRMDHWDSDVPDKMTDVLDSLGIPVTGKGKFIGDFRYTDEYETQIVQARLDKGKSSHDGSSYAMNMIITNWSDEDEAFVMGKNESFGRYEFAYSPDRKYLTVNLKVPKDGITVPERYDGESSWDAFKKGGALNSAGIWKEKAAVTFIYDKEEEKYVLFDGDPTALQYKLGKGYDNETMFLYYPTTSGARGPLKNFKVHATEIKDIEIPKEKEYEY